jgi:dihydrofolate synthase/folylpolyglutamate synthase
MVGRTLADWLTHAERQHKVGIDLGLTRVTRVAQAMGFVPPDHRPAPRCIIVAGTNGKGSTTVFAEALLRAAGHRVGATISPHVHRFNERVRLDGEPVADDVLCRAFETVEAARGDVTLTYFEYSTLVALHVFRDAAVDVAVLEVGLGGRLDAFNLVGADVAAITSIGRDHEAYLGSDLEGIGREKAGVMRAGRQVVAGEDVTASVAEEAARLGCTLRLMGRDFTCVQETGRWHHAGAAGMFRDLPWGVLAPYNCSVAIETVTCLERVTIASVQRALAEAHLPGRCEAWQIDGQRALVDVAHNPAGALFLRRLLECRYPGRRYVALLGLLADKDAAGVAAALAPLVDAWVCVPTTGVRGLAAATLAERLRGSLPGHGQEAATVIVADDLAQGLDMARHRAGAGSDVLAFGSFDLVERLRDALRAGRLAGGASAVPERSTVAGAAGR